MDLFKIKDDLRQADEFLNRGSQFNGYSAPDPIAAHLMLLRIQEQIGATECTCGHPFSHHTTRDVDDVVGWPCLLCRSQQCVGFAVAHE
jgi:hypothetical protein